MPFAFSSAFSVNCRIGSLEKHTDYERIDIIVNCRIGSLEIFADDWEAVQ